MGNKQANKTEKSSDKSLSQLRVIQHVKTVCRGNIFESNPNYVTSREGMYDNPNTQSKPLCCFYHSCKLRPVIRTFLPFLLWSLYLCLGSLLFTLIEDDGAAVRRQRIVYLQKKYPEDLANLIQFLRVNCSDNATEQIELVENLSRGVVDFLEKADYGPYTRPWDFFSSLIFCLTAISTIGKFAFVKT